MSVGGQVVARDPGKRKRRALQVVLARGEEIWGFQDLLLRGRPGIVRTRAGYVGPAGRRRPTYDRRQHHRLAIEITFSPALVTLADVVSFIAHLAEREAHAGTPSPSRGDQPPALVYYRDAAGFTSAVNALRDANPNLGQFDPYQLLVPVETFYEAEAEHQE